MTITKQYDEETNSKLAAGTVAYLPQAILFYVFITGLLVKANIWVWSSIF